MQNYTQSRPAQPRFPALKALDIFFQTLSCHRLFGVFYFPLICHCDYFGREGVDESHDHT